MELTITSKGVTHIVYYDDQDHHLISKYRWSMHPKGYVCCTRNHRCILMHRLILGVTDDSTVLVDHINHNKTDNRRNNIRICTRSENQRNVRPSGRSKYLGVAINEYKKKNGSVSLVFKAIIKTPPKAIYLGSYKDEISAAIAYDHAARKFHGDFANLNFSD